MKYFKGLRIKFFTIRQVAKGYFYDSSRFYRHATAVTPERYSEHRLVGYIEARCHIIEKGLTMPQMRLKFGEPVVESLISSCSTYLDKFSAKNCLVIHAAEVLKEYLEAHESAQCELKTSIVEGIERLVLRIPGLDLSRKQIVTSAFEYFSMIDSPFPEFAGSRHSVRNFSAESVPLDLIERAVELAQTAPTSCNRQPVRIRIVESNDLIKKILDVHTGNNGFGHLANKLIVVSAEISVYNEVRERNLPYIDSGIYSMNLLYSLHYFKIGACALNWSSDIDKDKKLRNLLDIPDSEVIALLIICGRPPEKFMLATSVRYSAKEIIKVY
jgi:nitroreductase